MENLGIYCGSFDPPTFGHQEVVKNSLEYCDQVYIVYLSPNPCKPDRTNDKYRKQMLEATFGNNPRVTLTESFRTDLPKILKQEYPGSKIVGIMGSDGALHYGTKDPSHHYFQHFDSWRVIIREGDKSKRMPKTLGGKEVNLIYAVPHQDLSSTKVRDTLLKNPSFFEHNTELKYPLPVSDEISKIIRKNKLYYLSDQQIISRFSNQEIVKVTNGLSGDRVYKIGEIYYKALIGSTAKINSQKEIAGMKTLRELKLPNLTTPEIIGFQDYSHFSIIQMTTADGQSLDYLMKTSETNLNQALKSAQTVGRRVAGIHMKTEKLVKNLGQTEWSRYVKDLNRTIYLLRIYPEFYQGLNIPGYIKLINRLKSKMETRSIKCVVSHGDANPANWFIRGQNVTAIDCGGMIDCGFSEKDYYEWLSVFRLVGNRHNLGNKEIMDFQRAFESGYNQIRTRNKDDVTSIFFRIYWISFALNFNSKTLLNPRKDKERAKLTISQLIKRINGELEGNSCEYF